MNDKNSMYNSAYYKTIKKQYEATRKNMKIIRIKYYEEIRTIIKIIKMV